MSLIYFPQLVAGLLPALLPALAGGPAAGWARPPGETVTQASLPLLGSLKRWGLLVTGWAEVIIKLSKGWGGAQAYRQVEEERLESAAFASLRWALQLQASHSNSGASVFSSVQWL